MKYCKQIKFDGTFCIVPKILYQLFTIFCFYREHTIPVIHILMTNKSEELYSACIQMVIEIIPDFEPNFAASDFENAPRCLSKATSWCSYYRLHISLYTSYLESSQESWTSLYLSDEFCFY